MYDAVSEAISKIGEILHSLSPEMHKFDSFHAVQSLLQVCNVTSQPSSIMVCYVSLNIIAVQAILENTIILFVCPHKFCISIASVNSWDHCKSQEKLETMLMQNLGGQKKSILVFCEVAYCQSP